MPWGKVMKLAITLTAGLALAGCAVEYTQTDLRSLSGRTAQPARGHRRAVVMYPVPAPTYNGYVDQRSIDIRDRPGSRRRSIASASAW